MSNTLVLISGHMSDLLSTLMAATRSHNIELVVDSLSHMQKCLGFMVTNQVPVRPPEEKTL